MQLVPITTNVVSSNPTHGEVYLIQHYVIKFVHGGGNRSTQRKPLTCRKSLTNFMT
jgi:hypothetical protein